MEYYIYEKIRILIIIIEGLSLVSILLYIIKKYQNMLKLGLLLSFIGVILISGNFIYAVKAFTRAVDLNVRDGYPNHVHDAANLMLEVVNVEILLLIISASLLLTSIIFILRIKQV